MSGHVTIQEILHNHITDQNNPHNVTKQDLNLGNIENYIILTEQEGESGTIPNRYITPLKLKLIFDGILKREGLMNADGTIPLF
ncbi:MAG: hypothetical protein IBX57_00975 [Gammaproteobacteria bacterium]|nr:hypothetical protein [Gammaproteobacteria bacterium]